jgi:hypothetical protein
MVGRSSLTLFAASILLLSLATEASAQRQPAAPRRQTPTQQTLLWAVQELARAEGMTGECANRRAMRRTLGRVRSELNRLLGHASALPPPPPPPAPTTPPPPQPMSGPDFSKLLDSVKAQAMTRGKLAVITQAASYNFFTCRQVIALINAVSFSRHKLKALKRLAWRVTDRQNTYTILDAFPFSRDRRKASKILAKVR